MIRFASVSGFTTVEGFTLQDALDVANDCIGSGPFKQAVLGFIQSDGVTPGFTYASGESNESIYNTIWEGFNQQTGPGIDISMRSYFGWAWLKKRDEIAEEVTGGGIILNRKFSRRPLSDWAGTITHEWLHTLGFSHPYKQCYDWTNSVPEAIGNLVAAMLDSSPRASSLPYAPRETLPVPPSVS